MAASQESDRAAALATSRRAFTLGTRPDMGGLSWELVKYWLIFSDEETGE